MVPGGTEPASLTDLLVPFRLLLADLVVITMAEEPTVSTQALSALTSSIDDLVRGVAHVKTVFRPTPLEPVAGRSVFYATTAPPDVGEALRAHLEGAHGARVVAVSHHLADRSALTSELTQAEGTYEVLITELKAAGVDVATRMAIEAGAGVVYADNLPVPVEGDLAGVIASVAGKARDRFEAHITGTR